MSSEQTHSKENEPAKLDAVDVAILQALSKNARAQLHELAAASNVSIPTARARLLRLQRLSIIRKFATELDFGRIVGKGLYVFVLMKLRIGMLNSVAEEVCSRDEVVEAFLTAGEQDLVIKVFVTDMNTFELFVKDKLATIEGVERITSNFVMEVLKDEPNPSMSLIAVAPVSWKDETLTPVGNQASKSGAFLCAMCNKEVPLDRSPIRTDFEQERLDFCSETCLSLFLSQRAKISKTS